MKKLLIILIGFIFVGCESSSDYFSEGEVVTVVGLQQSCNCVVSYTRTDNLYVNLLCEDEVGKYSVVEISCTLIKSCDKDTIANDTISKPIPIVL